MIKLKNVLNTVQSVRIKDRFGKFYTILIESGKTTDIENYQVTEDIINKVNQGSLLVSPKEAIIAKTKSPTLVVSEIPVRSEPNIVDSQETVTVLKEYSENDTNEAIENEATNLDTEETQSIYICDICGNEYASKRGLELHKSKAHK